MSEALRIQQATVEFRVDGGTIRAVDGVDLAVRPGETVAVVGESGCGKTTLARCVLGLQTMVDGAIELGGRPVALVSRDMAERVGMVWQDPSASLNPRWPVRRSLEEPLRLTGKSRDVDALFREVGLDPALGERYPHQLSGGQRQRVAIGRALATEPPLVICDEPTAALDLSIRAQILNLLKEIQTARRCAYLYISHDLTTVRFLADRVAVMYLGRIVEEGTTEEVFLRPRHPYTRALMDSAPDLARLREIPPAPAGEIPDPRERWTGCRYAGRCPLAQASCLETDPPEAREDDHRYFCIFPLRSDVRSGAATRS